MKAIPLDLSPARWIWFPSERTLANTFVLFRRIVTVEYDLLKATGWITADSRYRLTVNGQRVQWGPSPCDPRFLEADPVDLTAELNVGENVIGVEVLHYGHGDGTWAAGKPGLLFHLQLQYGDGQQESVISDGNWESFLDRAHRPGQYKRWYLRALQEDFDARLHPHGWNTLPLPSSINWLPAMELDVRADKPPCCGYYDPHEYGGFGYVEPEECELRERAVPMLRDEERIPLTLADAGFVNWKRDVRDWFEFRTPNSFEIISDITAVQETDTGYVLTPLTGSAAYVTFELKEQVVGWIYFTIEASEGTVIELMTQEGHDPAKTAWLDTHMYSWSRFTCRNGVNHFTTFDFESLRWLQLHIHEHLGPVKITQMGVQRRSYDWAVQPHIQTSDPDLQRLIDAGINTIYNSAQETIVDGMGRERQQYSGDIGHALHSIRYIFGEQHQPARYLWTYSQGITWDGYFLDCWPAYDRLWRIGQRQIGATKWGPLLDHSIGFCFDCWHHYLETGDLEAVQEPYARLLRFADYLHRICDSTGLLPVENLGTPVVWIDHEAYHQQRHKQCAFNLYAAAMLQNALAPLAQAFGDTQNAEQLSALGVSIQRASVQTFWSADHQLFINNLPWLNKEKQPRMCDRSIATAILYHQIPQEESYDAMLQVLQDCPTEMGFSYPANAGWRYHALISQGIVDPVLNEFRSRWANMKSVRLNNTLQEFWDAQSDSSAQWCHFPIAPLNVLIMDIAGIRPIEPGFKKCRIHPRLGSLKDLELTVQTVLGPIYFHAKRTDTGHDIALRLPDECEPELVLEPGVVIHVRTF